MSSKVYMDNKFGNPSTNHYIITDERGETMYSYDSPVAQKPADGGKVKLHPKYWQYSATTGFYRFHFLGESVAVTRTRIEAGEYDLVEFD